MKKNHLLILCLSLGIAASCTPNTDDNRTMDYDSLPVSFSISLDGQVLDKDSKIGILATCTRDDQEGTSMSANPVACYKTLTAGESSYLAPTTDNDAVVALKGDHNYRFYSIYPCPETPVDITAVPMSVPTTQKFYEGLMGTLAFVASAKTISVLPTVKFDMATKFSILELYIPNDLRDGYESVLSSIEITPADGFEGYIAQTGVYNAQTDKFILETAASSNKITVDFGEDGLFLKDAYTKVDVVIAPVTIPEGGFKMKFNDKDGSVTEISAYSSEKEVGTVLQPGATYPTYVSGISDGVIPVTFPVIFPCGYPNGDNTVAGFCNAANPWMSEWVNDPACAAATRTSEMWTGQHGKVLCKDQNQAFVTWNWDAKINETGVKHYIETANTASYYISTFGVKAVWTDDFFEFTIPVRKFAADSKLKLTMPFYTRSGPTFWEVLYKDGEEWKSTAVDNLPAFEGSNTKARATWALPFGGAAASANIDTDQVVTMTFKNAVPSGYLLIRVKCVDGSVVSSAANTVSVLEKPGANPFYFWNPDPDKRKEGQAIKIELL